MDDKSQIIDDLIYFVEEYSQAMYDLGEITYQDYKANKRLLQQAELLIAKEVYNVTK